MIDDTPEKKASLALTAQAHEFARARGGENMSADDRLTFETMMRRAADARSMHDVLEAAARVVARADGFGMSVTGRWLVVGGVTCTYVGILWLVLFEVSGGTLPLGSLGSTNTVVGTVILVPGVVLWVFGAALRRSGRSRARR
jgi:hypothetical protein